MCAVVFRQVLQIAEIRKKSRAGALAGPGGKQLKAGNGMASAMPFPVVLDEGYRDFS